MITRELIARLPKAELHVHLDGSLRPATMVDLARKAGVALPTSDPEALRRYMLVDDAQDLEEYLQRFDITIALLQDPEAIERVAWEMVEDAAADNVRRLEVRYCPLLSCRNGLTLDEVIEAEYRGLARGERDFGVKTGIINCSLRHFTPEQSIEIAEHSVRCRDLGVVAFDLAGGEAGRPPGVHGEAFDIAVRGCLGVTVHANRIGHGTRLRENPTLQDYIRDRRICVETNITSNVQTRAVGRAAEHPVRYYLDAGLNVTLCTDSWLMSGVISTDEYWLAHRELGFGRAKIDRLILPEKQALLATVRTELESLT
jgi:adenosine deaminase